MAHRDKASPPSKRSGPTLYSKAFVSVHVALLVTGRTAWTQDLLREQNQWRMVMGPSLLNIEQDRRRGLGRTSRNA
jgi:hypothetical protein